MTWSNRVVWQEGMFLRAQHFQQQDRWLETLVRGRTAALRPYPWGMVEMAIDRDLLLTGRFALSSAAGVFEDGTPFVIPGETDHPPPLDLPDTTRSQLVYLALPIRQAGAVEIAAGENTEGRYALRGFEAYDTHSASPQPAELQIGRLRLRYMLESDDRTGYHCIGLARVNEVAADRRVSLEKDWIVPCLLSSAAPPLAGYLAELAGLLNQRGEALAARVTAPSGTAGVAGVEDFLLLQSLNRWQRLITHWAEAGTVHPEDLYAALVQMAGEFATFTSPTRRPGNYPAYRHNDLQRSFAPVMADIRVWDGGREKATPIPLQLRQHNVRVGLINDRSILRAAQFVLTVQADLPTENLRRLFPTRVKIGAVEQIRELVNSALPGINVTPMPVAPRQLPFYVNANYFELDRNSPHWQQMQSAGAFAIHVQDEFPNLQLELWAIRG
jgi:type VI secretion system protein ImpJ